MTRIVLLGGSSGIGLATVVIDDAVSRGGVVVRDIAGVTVTEIIRLVKPNFDAPRDRGAYA